MHPIRTALMLSACLLLAACASSPKVERNPLATWVPSPNYNARKPVVIVLHHTEQASVQQSLKTLRTANSGGRVSAHYLIGADGHRYQLVADEHRAWHAGAGRWGTITDLNSASIGIELDNNGRSPFTGAQIDALIVLLRDLTTRLGIPPRQVIGHGDLAPGRKVDPSRFFPWQQLAQAGFGLWPRVQDGAAPDGFDAWAALARFGYPLDNRPAAAAAFHRHFRGRDDLPAQLDAEDARILYSLLLQLP
ncbi:N-acetylmuramoyl-L-alanine amidase [Stenotrophomonas sp. 24(2023)]|uniref:N-acetylmuramoyl-L-alanine amidase n=1 Tax=Stenotrophomonas sp. 24(2023) TaxID=3068324 RepID=UPI0027E1D1F3|nr:N-acetylmuramoyl-L-alanine amidase [Stenotrophomonas sp. 24(2023)]WMJ71200.1 N-acetylmuramoyl-L-alanine amidase [Stenotrophomonas sp. 24(2023)]